MPYNSKFEGSVAQARSREFIDSQALIVDVSNAAMSPADAQKLVKLANGAATADPLTEERYWEHVRARPST